MATNIYRVQTVSSAFICIKIWNRTADDDLKKQCHKISISRLNLLEIQATIIQAERFFQYRFRIHLLTSSAIAGSVSDYSLSHKKSIRKILQYMLYTAVVSCKIFLQQSKILVLWKIFEYPLWKQHKVLSFRCNMAGSLGCFR